MPETKKTVNFRIEPSEWAAAQEAAAKNDERISDVIRRALKTYVEETNR